MTSPFRMFLMSCALSVVGCQWVAAQSAEVFGGYFVANMKPENSALNRTTMNGWNTSVTGYPTSRVGFTADFTGSYAHIRPESSTSEVSVHQYSYMGGPQVRLFRADRFETSARALFGAARGYVPFNNALGGSTVNSPFDQTSFAALFGSNLDFNVSKRVALRVSPGLYLTQFGDETQKNFRFSVGPVFRFGGGER